MNKFVDIPTINISPFFRKDPKRQKEVAGRIHEVCRSVGFFYISNHGIDVKKLHEITTEFHQKMTDQEKWDLAINAYNNGNSHKRNGYYMAIPGKKTVQSYCYLNPKFTENHPAIKAKLPLHEVNKWPDSDKHPQFQDFCEGYFYQLHTLSKYILQGFALALGKEANFFETHLNDSKVLSAVSLIRYPYLEDYPAAAIKKGPDGALLSFEDHLDVSLITILYQTPISNLQVELEDGFRDLPVSGENFLVNAGTFMSYITNGYFHAPNHRVKYVNAERLSLPFFVNLGYDSVIEPFNPYNSHSLQDNPPISYGKYLENGLQALIVKNGQT